MVIFARSFGVLAKAGLGADCHTPVSPKSPSLLKEGLFVISPAFSASVPVTVLCISYLMRILPGAFLSCETHQRSRLLPGCV